MILVGTLRIGKTTLATALGIEACRTGKDVQFYRVMDLVDKVQKASHRGTLARIRKMILKCDLLILDELADFNNNDENFMMWENFRQHDTVDNIDAALKNASNYTRNYKQDRFQNIEDIGSELIKCLLIVLNNAYII